jgi:hypothetical protein
MKHRLLRSTVLIASLAGCASDSKPAAITSAPTTAPTAPTAATTTITATTTTVPLPGFNAHVATDVTLPGGAIVRFDGDVALSNAVVAEETGIAGTSHLFLFPVVTGTVTSDSAVTLGEVSVEFYLDPVIAKDCVTNVETAACDPALITRSAPGTSISVSKTAAYDFVQQEGTSRIDVPDETANELQKTVTDGSIVTGYAVVVTGSASDAVSSVIFNREGDAVLTCAGPPATCFDATRSVLTT